MSGRGARRPLGLLPVGREEEAQGGERTLCDTGDGALVGDDVEDTRAAATCSAAGDLELEDAEGSSTSL
jgi:hypothetical protein